MIPAGPHNDWPWPFRYIPRRWTAWNSEKPPTRLLGSATGHLDITPTGTWALTWPPYLTLRTRKGWHFRIGIRYDYTDHYYTITFPTIKKIKLV